MYIYVCVCVYIYIDTVYIYTVYPIFQLVYGSWDDPPSNHSFSLVLAAHLGR